MANSSSKGGKYSGSSALICKNLSGLAEECSGPIPSIPCGKSKTNPD